MHAKQRLADQHEALDIAIRRLVKHQMTDLQAGRLVRHMQVFYLSHENGYEPGGPKHNPRTWALVTRNAVPFRVSRTRPKARDPQRKKKEEAVRPLGRHASHIRELRPSAPARGIQRPIGAGYILAVYPYPFGKRPVGWHVYHVRNPNEWYAVGEADSFDDAIDAADRRFGVNPHAMVRDPRRLRGPIRPTARQRAFIAAKIPILIDEGYPQRQAVAISYRMAGVPPRGASAQRKKRRA